MNLLSLIQQSSFSKRLLSALTAFFFLVSCILPTASIAQTLLQTILNLPVPGSVVAPTAGFAPAMIKGINLYPDNPLKFDFIIDKGDAAFTDEEFKKESTRLIKYFLSSLTVPEDEMWVNLSPYEKNRIVPQDFGKTEMGRDLLAQDYMLKQLTASLMNPDDKLGGEFWQRVYSKAQEKYGTTDIPMNTFNKIWIVPEKAVVYEHEKGAFVVKSHLKVMLEEDYLALEANKNSTKHGLGDVKTEDLKVVSGVQSAIIKDLLIPEIEKEVNEGQTFANLRQIYNAVILASWYKQALKESLLGQVYIDQKKTKGVETADKTVNEQIYNQYVESFKKGVYNYIKEDYNPETQEVVNRKYFSGGVAFNRATLATKQTINLADLAQTGSPTKVEVDLASLSSSNAAMTTVTPKEIDTALNEIRVLSQKYLKDRITTDLMMAELFYKNHSQKSFNLLLEELRKLWDELKLDQDNDEYIGMEFEDATAYYLGKINSSSTLENNIRFLIHAPKSKEIIARFGAHLKAHLTTNVFHNGNVVSPRLKIVSFPVSNQKFQAFGSINGNSFIDNRLLPVIIEGFINQSEESDFQVKISEPNGEVIFNLNLYLLLSLIDPSIYPDTTLELGMEDRSGIPEEAKWGAAMKKFEEAFTKKFGKEEYLRMLIQLKEQTWMPEGAFLPWSFSSPFNLDERKKGKIGAGNFYGYRHPNVESKEAIEGTLATILFKDDFERNNNRFRELMDAKIAEAEQAVSLAKAVDELERRLRNVAGDEEVDQLINQVEKVISTDWLRSHSNWLKSFNDILIPKGYFVDLDYLLEKEERTIIVYKIISQEIKNTDQGPVTGYFIDQITKFKDGQLRGPMGWKPSFGDYVLVFSGQIIKRANDIQEILDGQLPFTLSNRFDIFKREGRMRYRLARLSRSFIRKGLKTMNNTEEIISLLENIAFSHEVEHVRQARALGDEYLKMPSWKKESFARLRSMKEANEPFNELASLIHLAAFNKSYAWYILQHLTNQSSQRTILKDLRDRFLSMSIEEFKTEVSRVYQEAERDAAMMVESNQMLMKKNAAAAPGGIDLNPTILSTEIKRTGRGVIIPAFKGPRPDLNGMEGFVPNIINVTPIMNLQLLLGLDTKPNDNPSNPKNEKPVDVSFNLSALPAKEREELSLELVRHY